MENPLISICVPTFNQPKELDRLLESMAPQLNSKTELLICDDSSGNESEMVVKKYSDKFAIKYLKGSPFKEEVRHERGGKGGFDRAIILLTSEAKGKYIWWMGDDALASNAVSTITSHLENSPETVFVWLNSRDINNPADSAINLGGNKFFKDKNELLAVDMGLLGFPSATIVRGDLAKQAIPGSKKFIGTTLTAFYMVMYVISGDGKYYFVQEPLILSDPKPPGEVRWFNAFMVFGVYYCLIAEEFRSKFEKWAIRDAFADRLRYTWKAVVVSRAMGYNFGSNSYFKELFWITRLYWSYPMFWVALPFILMPGRVIKPFYSLFKRIKYGRKNV